MTTLADAKLAALETLTGNTGHVNDLEAEYLVLLGASASTVVDMWHEVFDNAAIAAGQHNDRWMAYMDSILSPATEDQYNDREREFWDGGGTPIGPPLPFAANVRHCFDFGDLSKLFSLATCTGFKPNNTGNPIGCILNDGSDGTPLVTQANPTSPQLVLDPTGLKVSSVVRFDAAKLQDLLATIAAGLPSGVGTGYAVAIVLRGREDPPITSRAFTWGDSVAANTRILGAGVRAPANDFGDTLLNSNVIVTEQPPFTQVMVPYNWFAFVGTVSDDGSGIQDNFISARRGLTPFTGVINSQASQGRPIALDRFIVGNQSSGGVPWDGDVAKIWVWDVGILQAGVDQMLTYLDFFYPEAPLLAFPAAGIQTLPGIESTILFSGETVPAGAAMDVEGVTPNSLILTGDAWVNHGIYPGDTIFETAGTNLGLVPYLVQKLKITVGFNDTADLKPAIPGNFGPFSNPPGMVLEVRYDPTEDRGLLATSVDFDWVLTRTIQLPADGTSNWEALGMVEGDILRFENSDTFADTDERVTGFFLPQGGGNRAMQLARFQTVPFVGNNIADIRLIRRAVV